MSSTDKISLRYFPICGRAEPIRMMLEDAGVAYDEDNDTAAFRQEKKDCDLYPFNQLPRVQVDGMNLAQQDAILRYLAKKFGYVGQNKPEQDVTVDMLACAVEDLNTTYTGAIYNEKHVEMLLEFVTQHVPKVFAQFELLYSKSKSTSSYLVYEHPSFAEFTLAYLIFAISHLKKDILADFPRLQKFYEAFMAREGLKAYVASGRRKEMLNGSASGQNCIA